MEADRVQISPCDSVGFTSWNCSNSLLFPLGSSQGYLVASKKGVALENVRGLKAQWQSAAERSVCKEKPGQCCPWGPVHTHCWEMWEGSGHPGVFPALGAPLGGNAEMHSSKMLPTFWAYEMRLCIRASFCLLEEMSWTTLGAKGKAIFCLQWKTIMAFCSFPPQQHNIATYLQPLPAQTCMTTQHTVLAFCWIWSQKSWRSCCGSSAEKTVSPIDLWGWELTQKCTVLGCESSCYLRCLRDLSKGITYPRNTNPQFHLQRKWDMPEAKARGFAVIWFRELWQAGTNSASLQPSEGGVAEVISKNKSWMFCFWCWTPLASACNWDIAARV